LPSGPYKGKTADKAEVDEDKLRYYEEVGWDKKGIPKTEVLRELGLENVDIALTKIRKTSID
jgi:aldehyde:ferredoxin oxidoreductase